MEPKTNPSRELTKVEVIWDREHGHEGEGWRLRSTYAEGYTEEERVDALDVLKPEADEDQLRGVAFSHFCPPEGLNEEQADTLRSMIVVTR